MSVALGGRVAEKQVFSEIATGAANDLQMANKILHAFVTQYGMSDAMPDWVSIRNDAFFSPATQHVVDEEIKRLLKECHDYAKGVLTMNRRQLKEMAEALLEHERLSGLPLEQILRKVKKPGATTAS